METDHDISHGLRFVTSRVRWRWNPYLGVGGIELTEEEIEEYVKDDNYMFTVEGWFADQSGRWDNSDVQYDSEFANLFSSYRDGWLKPPTRTAEVVKEEILYVEELVDGWSNDERHSNSIDYYNE